MDKSYYVLDVANQVVSCDSETLAQFFKDNESREWVAFDEVNGACVSTVFLGINHNFTGEGPPIVFETMIFGGLFDEYQERYTTYQEALKGHARAILRCCEELVWDKLKKLQNET